MLISIFFDSLIREVDIFTEEKIVDLDSDKLIKVNNDDNIKLNIEESNNSKYIDGEIDFDSVEHFDKNVQDYIWSVHERPSFDFKRNLDLNKPSKCMKECDFWNESRDELIAELNDMQNEAFQRYETIRDESKRDKWSIETIMERVFENRFAFIFKSPYDTQEMHLIELDFYLNPFECQLLRF